jgi:hypothetical protein
MQNCATPFPIYQASFGIISFPWAQVVQVSLEDLGRFGRQELEIGLYDSRNFPKSLELAPEQLWEDYHFSCSLAHEVSRYV